jgi:hypothetical protein
VEVEFEYWLADRAYTSPTGRTIERNTIGAYIFNQYGMVRGRGAFTTSHVNRFGPHSAPEWPVIGHDGGYRIEITGSTPMVVDIPLGFAGGRGSALADAGEVTAVRLVNSIVPVIEASPGYKTFLDLAPLGSFLDLPRRPG